MNKMIFALLVLMTVANYSTAQTEPSAGKWKTWFIRSVKDFHLPPPPNPNASKKELGEVIVMQQHLDSSDKQQVTFWSAGSPSYRWQRVLQGFLRTDTTDIWPLAFMVLKVASYDAVIAAWDAKYTFNRFRPYQMSDRIKILSPKNDSPSYPCEYSVVAGTASRVIAHFYPNQAGQVQQLAEKEMRSRILAGMALPSDTKAGFELGVKIGDQVIQKIKSFIPDVRWDGKIPDKPGVWNGKKPWNPLFGTWKTMVLDSGSQYRPEPPPDFKIEMEELKKFTPTARSIANAFYHASQYFWEETTDKKVFEYNLHLNPPRAERVYALTAIANYDALVSSFDAKYTYWGIRPDQYDTTYHPPLIETPQFPGYPSAHAEVAGAYAIIMSYLFPSEKEYFWRKANDAAESRFEGGVHFRTDNEVGMDMGKKVGAKVLLKAEADGAN